MSRKVTIEDVARESNASAATVSLVLRHKPGISPETRQRVLEAAQALGYRPRTPATAASTPATLNVGLILRARTRSADRDQSVVNPFYSWVVTGIDAAARQQRLNLLYASVPVDENNRPLDPPRHLLDQRLDGLLLVGAFSDATIAEFAGPRSTPTILVDAPAHQHRFDTIASDNEGGAYTAVSYLISRGHREIAIVGAQPEADPNFSQRRDGYLRAMREHGLDTYIASDGRVIEEAADAVAIFLRRNPQITALFGSNDAFAVAALRAAHAVGQHVPDDLSIMGFDDIELGQQTSPQLTTMAVDKVGMGRLAVQLLAYRLAWPDAAITLTTLQPRLLERRSVKARN
jgi:DNA-binding LacI/PurR family transcriptional regulator